MPAATQIAINNEGGFWPTPQQELMLRAALLPGQAALDAWKQWESTVDIEVIDFGSHRLIPQVYFNLLAQGVRHPWMDKFKGVYRYYWYKNKVLLHRVESLLKTFADAGLDCMVLKGAALIPLYYKDCGLRPMQDFDVLIRPGDLGRATALLQREGWRSLYPPHQAEPLIKHSNPFKNGDGHEFDLHWHALFDCWRWTDDLHFWDHAIPLQIGGIATRTLDPTDQLLHACWHGANWCEVPPVRWVADAFMILHAPQAEIDWDRFIRNSTQHQLSVRLLDCLRYLRDLLGAPVPLRATQRLQEIPTSRMEHLGYELAADPLRPRSVPEMLRALRYSYWWLTSGDPFWQKPVRFARFLQAMFDVPHMWQLPWRLLLRAARSLWKRLTRPVRRASQDSPRDARVIARPGP